MLTYWIYYPRDFANEFTINIATSSRINSDLKDLGYERISRRWAIKQINRQDTPLDHIYRSVQIDLCDVGFFFSCASDLIDQIHEAISCELSPSLS